MTQTEFLRGESAPKRQRLDSDHRPSVDEQNFEDEKSDMELGERFWRGMQRCSSLSDSSSDELAQESTEPNLLCFGMVFHIVVSSSNL